MVTIVVPTYNRLELLKKCLATLYAQHTNVKHAIIVVDDGSTDGTIAWLASQTNKKLRVVRHVNQQGKSAARNAGIAAASGDIVAFTDDDMTVAPNWLKELTQLFTDEVVVCVYGETRYIGDSQPHYFPQRIVANPGARFPMAGNIAYRLSTLKKTGGFDPFFDTYANEDTELALRLLPLGQFISRPSAIAYHVASRWTAHTLLASAKNASVWPLLYKKYAKDFPKATFKLPLWHRLVYPKDLLALLICPVLIPFLLLRYLYNGQRDLKLFFTKWPLLLLYRRYLIWKEAWRHKVLVI